jgi:deferrochelatase/peroxidase EfeB
MQGLIMSGYFHLPHAAFLLLSLRPAGAGPHDPAPHAARAWLGAVADRVTDGDARDPECLNVAVTAAGLRALSLADAALEQFARPFVVGMACRSRFLGDDEDGAVPKDWRWRGGVDGKPDVPGTVHALLMVYAQDKDALAAALGRERGLLAAAGVREVAAIPLAPFAETEWPDPRTGERVAARREPFGFADGGSQPVLMDYAAGAARGWGRHGIAAGDVVLGRLNAYGESGPGILVGGSDHETHALRRARRAGDALHDLGRNGTYLVLRQVRQDVAAFWRDVAEQAARFGVKAEWLAEKLVGRTLNGDVLQPGGPRPRAADGGPDNEFDFYAGDRTGRGCPVGSHIRRANPRDGLTPPEHDGSPDEIRQAVNRHRILRRGRPYGPPSPGPGAAEGEADAVERGLAFVCLNADIERQFEFIQHTWLNNRMFAALQDETDGLVGPPGPVTIPADPVRLRPVLQQHVTPVGGEYFFLPSRSALRYLAGLPLHAARAA